MLGPRTNGSVAAHAACAELAARIDGLHHHPDATGRVRSPYLSGEVAADGAVHVDVLRSDRWHGDGTVVRVAGGPYGPWAKPPRPDPDRQEGGLTFLPEHEVPQPGDLLTEFVESHTALNELWCRSRTKDADGDTREGLVVMVRPDGVVGHLRDQFVDADALELLIRCLPDVAEAAQVHDPDWRETVRPPRDQFLWTAPWIVAIIVVLVVAGLLLYRWVDQGASLEWLRRG